MEWNGFAALRWLDLSYQSRDNQYSSCDCIAKVRDATRLTCDPWDPSGKHRHIGIERFTRDHNGMTKEGCVQEWQRPQFAYKGIEGELWSIQKSTAFLSLT